MMKRIVQASEINSAVVRTEDTLGSISYQPAQHCGISANTLEMFPDKFRLMHIGHLPRPCSSIELYQKGCLNVYSLINMSINLFIKGQLLLATTRPQVLLYHLNTTWAANKTLLPFSVAPFWISPSQCFHWRIWVTRWN